MGPRVLPARGFSLGRAYLSLTCWWDSELTGCRSIGSWRSSPFCPGPSFFRACHAFSASGGALTLPSSVLCLAQLCCLLLACLPTTFIPLVVRRAYLRRCLLLG